MIALTLPRVVARTATCVCLRGAGTQMRCNSGTRTLQLALIQPHRAHPASVDICGERWTLKKGRDAKMITRLHDVADLRRRVGGTANRHEEWLIDEASRDSFPAFFFKDTTPTEINTLSLHADLPILNWQATRSFHCS